MKRQLLLLLFASCLAWVADAQTVTISGQVLFGQNAEGAPFFPVYVQIGSPGNPGSFQELWTDQNGHYEGDFPYDDPATSIIVSVTDFCTGVEQGVSLPDANGSFVANFHICEDILPPPPPGACSAYFTYQQTDVAPYTVSFIDLSFYLDSLQNNATWNWDFGDGASSAEQNPIHDYAAPGSYPVILTFSVDTCASTFVSIVQVTDTLGCICPDIWAPVCVMTADSFILQFSNDCEAICAGFTPDQFTSCEPSWDFCYADFQYWIEGPNPASGYTVHFSDSSFNPSGQIILYEWHFGDGQVSNEANPVHNYQPGGYVVSLTITTSDGCTSTSTQFILIGQDCICPAIYAPVCVALSNGTVFTFTNSCEAECAGFTEEDFVSCDPGGCVCPEYYAPVCVFTADGQQLTFDNPCFAECAGFGPEDFFSCNPIDSCACPAIYDPVCVSNDSLTFTFPNACYAICAGYDSTQFVSCQDSTGCICPAVYDPVCVITPAGEELHFINLCYAICAGFGPDQIVNCNTGGESCYADFYTEFDPVSPNTVHFIDLSFSQSGSPISWYWTFGDGNASTEANPTYTYASEGVFEVSLTIVTADGCTSTTTQHICVGGGGYEGPECQALFFFVQDSTQAGAYQFINYSFGDITSWNWDFGDGTTSTDQFPTHVYTQPGVYPVTLTVSSENCTSSITVLVVAGNNIWYNSECSALFVPFIESDSQFVFLLNLSSPDAVSYHWDFGDGQSSEEYITSHFYEQAGVYIVTLTVTTASGCVNTYSATIDLINNNFVNQPAYLVINETSEVLDAQSILASPNPTSGQVNLRFNANSATNYRLSVFNFNGQVLQQFEAQGTAGPNTQTLDLSNFPSGIYGIKIQTGEEVHTLKVVKE